jgi:L-asparaginase
MICVSSRVLTVALYLGSAVAPHVARSQASTKAAVHILATGGTIGSAGDYYGGRATRVGVEQLVRSVPAIDTAARVSVEQFANLASSSITTVHWLAMTRRISELFQQRPELAGVVVTHGTDTMEETAYFLDLPVPGDRPVVVTGAMRPADGVGADGPANLLNAVRLAASPLARGRGVMVLMNDEIFAARDVAKTNTTRPNAFRALDRGPLGITDPEVIVFHRPAVRRATFDVSGLRDLPRVDIIYSYVGADSAAVDAVVAAGARGIVVAATGRGSVPPLQQAALERAEKSGVVVVVGSRAGSGRVPSGRGQIGAGDLNAQKARVLLMLALTRTHDAGEIARIFAEQQ